MSSFILQPFLKPITFTWDVGRDGTISEPNGTWDFTSYNFTADNGFHNSLYISNSGIKFTDTSTATIDMNGTSFNAGSIFSLSSSVTLTNTSATPVILTIGLDNLPANFFGVINDGSAQTSLVKSGTDQQAFFGNHPYTGPTTINSGTIFTNSLANGGLASPLGASTNAASNLIFNNGTLFYNGTTTTIDRSFTIQNGGTATINVANALTISGAGANTTGNLIKTGTGTLSLTGNNLYTGLTTVTDQSELTIGNGGTTGNISGGLFIDFISLARIQRTDAIVFSNIITGTGSLYTDYNIELSGNSSAFAGILNIATGTQTILDNSFSSSAIINVLANSQLLLNSSGTYSSTINLNGGTDYNGFGNIACNASATVSGNIILNANSYIGGNSGILTISGPVSGPIGNLNTYSLTVDGTLFNLYLTNDSNHSSSVTINSSNTLYIGNGGATGNLPGTSVSNSGTLTFNLTTTHGAAAGISGIGTFNQNGTGITTISGTNTYTGPTNINAGQLILIGSLGSGSYAANILNNAIFVCNNSSSQTLSGVISGTGHLYIGSASASTLILSNTNTYTGQTTIQNGTLQISGSGSLGSGTYTNILSNGGIFQYSSSINQTLSGLTSYSPDSGSLVKDTSSSILILNNNSTTYAGSITITTGTIQFSGTTLLNGGSYSNTITDNGTLQWSATSNQTLSGILSGSGSLIKDTSSSTLTLSANNTYSGPITITTGTLQISGSGYIGSGNFSNTITNNDTFRYSSSYPQTLSGVISGAGSLTKDTNNSAITLSANNTFTGNINVLNGTITITSPSWTVSNFINITSPGILQIDITTLTISGVISGNGTLQVGDIFGFSTTASLSATNPIYTGPIVIYSGGTLQISGGGGLAGGAYANTITNSGEFQYSSSLNQTLSGVISGAGTLIKDTNTSTLVLSGTNTYTGSTTINDGVLQVSGSIANTATTIGSSGTLQISGSGTLNSNIAITNNGLLQISTSSNQTFSHTISGSGNIQKDTFSSTLSLAGGDIYTGSTNTSIGIINCNNTGAFTTSEFIISMSNSSPTTSNSGQIHISSYFVPNIIQIFITETGTGISYPVVTWTGTYTGSTSSMVVKINGATFAAGATSGTTGSGTSFSFNASGGGLFIIR